MGFNFSNLTSVKFLMKLLELVGLQKNYFLIFEQIKNHFFISDFHLHRFYAVSSGSGG
jgi:hypothetical protein